LREVRNTKLGYWLWELKINTKKDFAFLLMQLRKYCIIKASKIDEVLDNLGLTAWKFVELWNKGEV